MQLQPNQIGQWLIVTWSQSLTATIACVATAANTTQKHCIRIEPYVAPDADICGLSWYCQC